MKVDVPEDLIGVLRDIVDACEKEDTEIRLAQLKQWKRAEEYWRGMQMIFWSEANQAWISPGEILSRLSNEERASLGPIYDYVVDIYKAHGESIIAALAAGIPAVRYRPDDADNEMDRLTAMTYSKIADLIYVHNKAKLLMLRALYYLYNTGVVFSYKYVESSPEFGTVVVPTTEVRNVCTSCGKETTSVYCEDCGAETSLQPVNAGETTLPKSRVKIEIFGPLHVKVPYYATDQSNCGYLILKTDQHKALVKSIYQHIADEVESESTSFYSYYRFPRTFTASTIDHRMHLVTVEKAWLRPWMFWSVNDPDKRDRLLKLFPRGAQVTFIGPNRIFAEAYDESLDERWDIGQSSLSTYIHSDPIGRTLLDLQDIRNQLVNLTIDTIEHGIPAVYVDSEVLEFDTYGRFESRPGVIYPATPRPGQSLMDSFAQEPKSVLSKEHMLYFRQIDQDAQFASGDFPSIHGGPSEGKSRTLGEYAISRQQAMQRLTIIWEFVLDWWLRTIDGAVKLYAATVIEDQQYTKKVGNDYITVWIKRSEMEGRVGGIEVEAGSGVPVTLVQKRESLFKLIELNNPILNKILYTPENASILTDLLAINELVVPGEEQRLKQAKEINELVKGEPVELETGELLPTVQVDPDVDDHETHIAVLQSYLVGTTGLDLRDSNPAGYMNCVAHLRMHRAELARIVSGMEQQNAENVPINTGRQ